MTVDHILSIEKCYPTFQPFIYAVLCPPSDDDDEVSYLSSDSSCDDGSPPPAVAESGESFGLEGRRWEMDAVGSPVPLTIVEDGNDENDDGGGGGMPIVLVLTSMDSTFMFHNLSPGAKCAALNVLTVLMAANLVRSSIEDDVLDSLHGRIIFSFFQGKSYGYVGSWNF
jgi:hypothetical protein